MFAARILYPVEVLGPGKRIGLWLSGCARKCPGCSNPELWEQKQDQQISPQRLSGLFHRLALDHPVDGITITGGEPMDQAEELAELLPLLRDLSDDILLYSGYTLEEIRKKQGGAEQRVLENLAVLVDGDYQERLNDASPLRGSSNQRVHIFRESVRSRYKEYLKGESRIQNFSLGNSIVSAGIHRPDYQTALKKAAGQKGLIERD